ncbi:MAG: cysteine--tRNA ligase [Rhodothermaceae bacterium]|nr:MAG: cysteine--tRNA ligase [Rhodothermaceae bacterium]
MPSEPVFRLYNTLTNRVEPVVPREAGHLRFYTCGPTVYSYAHIGNFRSFLTADLILRTARALGWRTTYVTNITDVGHLTEDDLADTAGEDRMMKALRSKEGQRFANIWDLARFYTQALLEDWHTLNLREPDVRPRATEHVAQQIRAVERLIAQGQAYETRQGVYFHVPTFPDYGKLSGNREAGRLDRAVRDVIVDPEKRDPRDFALWKKDEKHLMQWYSPWGWGFPGWHIECSVMAMTYLGEELDLHTGGEDNIFPHHECEIAQSESLTGKPFARHWVHTRFLQVEGEKMSKSAGNFFTVRDLTRPEHEGGRGIDPLALRMTLIAGHYRQPYNFTFQTLKASLKHVERFREAAALIDAAEAAGREGSDHLGPRLETLYEQTLAAMCDDLNTPEAIARTLEGTRLILGFGDNLNAASARAARAWMNRTNDLLGILAREHERPAPAEADPLAAEVEALLAEREAARKARDFARADAIREALAQRGIEVMDTPQGPRWKKKITL